MIALIYASLVGACYGSTSRPGSVRKNGAGLWPEFPSAQRVFVGAAGLQGGGPEEPAIKKCRHSRCHEWRCPSKSSVIRVMSYVFRGSGSAQAESCYRNPGGTIVPSLGLRQRPGSMESEFQIGIVSEVKASWKRQTRGGRRFSPTRPQHSGSFGAARRSFALCPGLRRCRPAQSTC